MRENITPLVLIVGIIAFYYIAMAVIERTKTPQSDIPITVQAPKGWDSRRTNTSDEIKYTISKGNDTITLQIFKPGSK